MGQTLAPVNFIPAEDMLRKVIDIVGRFGIVGGPITKLVSKQMDQLKTYLSSLPGLIGSNESETSLGNILHFFANERFQASKDAIEQLYQRAENIGQSAGSVIPTGEVSLAAQKLNAVLARNQIKVTDPRLQGLIDRLQNLGGKTVNYSTWKNDIMQGINEIVYSLSKDGQDLSQVMQLKQAAKSDLLNSPNQRLVSAAQAADNQFSQMMDLYTSSTAKRFNLATKGMFNTFGTQSAGTRTPGDLGNVLLNINSPQGVQELRQIVGQDRINEAASTFLNRNIQKFMQYDTTTGKFTFDAQGFRDALGLSNPKSARYTTVQEMFQGTGTDMNRLTEIADIADRISKTPAPNASVFLARRMVIGGLKSMLAAFVPGITKFGREGIATLGTALIGRYFSAIAADPTTLQNFATMMSPSVNNTAARMAAFRVLQHLVRAGLGDETQTPGQDQQQ
jgi:hypothetical protein